MHLNKKYVYFLIFVFATILFSMTLLFFVNKQSTYFVSQKPTEENLKMPEAPLEIEIIDNTLLIEKNSLQEVEEDLQVLTITDEAEASSQEIPIEEETPVEKIDSYAPLPDYVPAKRDPNEIKIGFITDLHVKSSSGPNNTRILKEVFIDRINHFVEKMNNEIVPDFILINGDVIEGTKIPASIGTKELQLTKALFDRTKIQKYWVLGNHDLRSVNKKQWEDALAIDYTKKSFNFGNYKIIILDSNFTKEDKAVSPGNGYTRGRVSAEEIKWLKKEIKDTNKKTIIFIHHPPLWNINNKSNTGFPDNSEELRVLFAQHKVLAVFAGHIEDLYYEKTDDVKYFVTPGLYKHPEYQATSSVISIKDNKISLIVSYLKDNKEYRQINLK